MLQKKKIHPAEKTKLHPRNKHRERYDFKLLIDSCPELKPFVKLNKYDDLSVDFFIPLAVKMLNTALLKHFYEIDNWDIPKGYLCPPIPGRADYIHHIADLLGRNTPGSSEGEIPRNQKIKCLDIGVGANCVYPIIGTKEYGWSFVGSDIDPVAIESASKIIESNSFLKGKIELRLQKNPKNIFVDIINKDERFDLTISNPPFHSSLAEARAGSLRKVKNLKQKKISKPILNFGGKEIELSCEGGEKQFVHNMVQQSKQFATSCLWFSTMVSSRSNLDDIYKTLKKVDAFEVKTILMGQGNKKSRIIAWTFFNREQQVEWQDTKLKQI